MKRNQKISALVASILLSNSLASAAFIDNNADKLAATTADLSAILSSSDKTTVSELKLAYEQILAMSNSLKTIQANNNQDPILKVANMAQVILVGATTLSLKTHLGKTDSLSTGKNYSLQLAAASSLLAIWIRFYTKMKSIEPENVSDALKLLNDEILVQNKTMTPEMAEMLTSINTISKDLISNKSEVEGIIKNITGTSNVGSFAIILMALAQWISPKFKGDSENFIKKYGTLLINKGSTVAAHGGVVKSTGVVNGLPDLIGIAMGLNGEKSQSMITETVLNLNSVLIQLKAQIDQTAN